MVGGGPAWTSYATYLPGMPEKRMPGQPNSYAEMMTVRGQQADIAREVQNSGAANRAQQDSKGSDKAAEEEPSEQYKKEREELKKVWPSQYAFEEAMKKGGK